jgi:methionyl-tRNA formyltransferase
MILIINKNSFFKKNKSKIKVNNKNLYFISDKKKINFKYIKKINPKIIFVPHWSHLISRKITESFLCIGFHSSPLPYGRGGSPIQNMIIRNFNKTKICAILLEKKLDAGKIVLQRNLSLKGNANIIYDRIYLKILEMINLILKIKNINGKKQIGKIVNFKRRNSLMSMIPKKKSINYIYNHIRMLSLDEKKFPKAFINYGNLKIELFESNLIKKKGEIICKAKIFLKK